MSNILKQQFIIFVVCNGLVGALISYTVFTTVEGWMSGLPGSTLSPRPLKPGRTVEEMQSNFRLKNLKRTIIGFFTGIFVAGWSALGYFRPSGNTHIAVGANAFNGTPSEETLTHAGAHSPRASHAIPISSPAEQTPNIYVVVDQASGELHAPLTSLPPDDGPPDCQRRAFLKSNSVARIIPAGELEKQASAKSRKMLGL